jgi:hypothetical protein
VRECERGHQGQGLSGRMGGGLSASGRLSPLPAGRWLLAVTQVSAPRQPDQRECPSNGADDSFAVEERRLGRPPTANPLAPIRLEGARVMARLERFAIHSYHDVSVVRGRCPVAYRSWLLAMYEFC